MPLSSEATAAKLAASLGVTDMKVAEINRMLELKDVLLPMFQVSIAFMTLAWFAVSLRMYARVVILRSFRWDDCLILLTLGTFSACSSCLIAIQNVETSEAAKEALASGFTDVIVLVDRIFRLVMGFMSLYIVTTIVLKLSLAIFFLRIIPDGFNWQRKTIYVATAVYTTYGLMFTFIIIFQCGNPSKFFKHEAKNACVSDSVIQPLYYAAGGMNALTDWVFSLLPVTVIWNAAIPRASKISAGCLLGLGSLASIASLVRVAYIPGIEASPTFLEHAVHIASWSIVEPGLGIIAASLATLRPLFRHCSPNKQQSVLPTTHKDKPLMSTPGTYVARMSFEDKVTPYGDLKMGYVTTVVGNSKGEQTELQSMDRKVRKNLTSIREMSVHSRTPSTVTVVSRMDNEASLKRETSLKSLIRHDRYQFPRPPTAMKRAYIQDGRVVMSRDIKIQQELSVSRSQPSSPV